MKCPNCNYNGDGWPCSRCGYTADAYLTKLNEVLTGEQSTLAAATDDPAKASAQAGIDAVKAKISEIQAMQVAQDKPDLAASEKAVGKPAPETPIVVSSAVAAALTGNASAPMSDTKPANSDALNSDAANTHL